MGSYSVDIQNKKNILVRISMINTWRLVKLLRMSILCGAHDRRTARAPRDSVMRIPEYGDAHDILGLSPPLFFAGSILGKRAAFRKSETVSSPNFVVGMEQNLHPVAFFQGGSRDDDGGNGFFVGFQRGDKGAAINIFMERAREGRRAHRVSAVCYGENAVLPPC